LGGKEGIIHSRSRTLREKVIVAQLINTFLCHFWNPEVQCDLYERAKSEALVTLLTLAQSLSWRTVPYPRSATAATLLYLEVVSSIFSPRLLHVMRRDKLNTREGLELLGRLGCGRILGR
jgi:hypothetical protein